MIHAIDTETTGLRHSHGDKAFAIGYSDDKEQPVAIALGIDDMVPIDAMMLCTDKEWVGHNIGFDLPFLADFQLLPKTIHDTMIAAHVYNNLEPSYGLDVLASKYCKIPNTEDEKLDKWFVDNGYNKDNRKYIDVPWEIMEPYLKADIRRTVALFKFYKAKGVIDDPAYKTEMELVPVVAKIAARGMRVDVDYAKQQFYDATHMLAKYENIAKQVHGVENIGSVQQVAECLFTRDKLKCTTFTDKGNICLDETAINKYEHPLVKIVLQHRELSKVANTYLKAIIELNHEGRLHSTLRQVGARTSRFSSSAPNLQNIPRSSKDSLIDLRKAFICSERSRLLLVDLSQIELRLLAHYSKEPSMIETLQDRKGDIHTTTAINMFGEVNDEVRTVAKTLNFAVIYGAGGEALVEQLNKALPHKHISLAQAKDFKQKFFKGYPLVQQFLWDVQKRIAERGFVTGKSGRKYQCDRLFAYKASNYLIQGEAAMLMKRMMIDVEKYLTGRHTQLINVIHDEFLFDLYETDEDCIQGILNCIEQPEGWRVPIFANASISDTNWASKRKLT